MAYEAEVEEQVAAAGVAGATAADLGNRGKIAAMPAVERFSLSS